MYTIDASVPDVLNASAGLLWPLIVVFVLLFLGSTLKSGLARALASRSFTLKVGSFELTAQEASEGLARQVEDLGAKVRELSAAYADLDGAGPAGLGPDGAGAVDSDPATVQGGEGAGVHRATVALPVDDLSVGGDFRRILWVDDEPANNAYEVAAVERRGITVDAVRDTASALGLLETHPYDAVLTDMGVKRHRKVLVDRHRKMSVDGVVIACRTAAR